MNLEKVNSLKEKGNKAYSEGKYDDALVFYKDALESLGSADLKIAAILHSNITQAYLQKNDYSLAVESATESLKLDPSFTKSNFRRAIANFELDNLADAMNDLRLIFSSELHDKTANDLMKRCSDKPNMKLELHEIYVKHCLRQILKKLAAQKMSPGIEVYSGKINNALLRQSFLSSKGLDIANHFFRDTFVGFDLDQSAILSISSWIACQFMRFKRYCSPIFVYLSDKLFKLLYRLLRPETFSLAIFCHNSLNDETLLSNRYLDVYLAKESLLEIRNVDESDLELMKWHAIDMTRLVYHPGLSNFKKTSFLRSKVLTFDGKHPITGDFLKLLKKSEWPIESLVFVHGILDFQSFKQFNGVVSSKVKNVFIRFAEENQNFNETIYNKLCNDLSTLKSVFPSISNVNIAQWYRFDVLSFPAFVQMVPIMFYEAYDTFSTKPDWCSKLRVVIFVTFLANSRAESKMFDVKLLEQPVELLRQEHPDMQIRLCGPRNYDSWWAKTAGVHAVIEFENETACFELAFLASVG